MQSALQHNAWVCCFVVGFFFHGKWNHHFKNSVMSFYSAVHTLMYSNNLL